MKSAFRAVLSGFIMLIMTCGKFQLYRSLLPWWRWACSRRRKVGGQSRTNNVIFTVLGIRRRATRLLPLNPLLVLLWPGLCVLHLLFLPAFEFLGLSRHLTAQAQGGCCNRTRRTRFSSDLTLTLDMILVIVSFFFLHDNAELQLTSRCISCSSSVMWLLVLGMLQC